MKEIEAFVLPKKKSKAKRRRLNGSDSEDVYDMCEQLLDDLSQLDSQLDIKLSPSPRRQGPNIFEGRRYEAQPVIQMRETDKRAVDFERLRQAQLRNLESLYDNIGGKLDDEEQLRQEVKEFVKASKSYKKQYKAGIARVDKRDSTWSPLNAKQPVDLFNCERRNNGAEFDHVPAGDRKAQEWLKNRKVDKHLDLDFLPRSLVYNIDDLADSSKQMETALQRMAAEHSSVEDKRAASGS